MTSNVLDVYKQVEANKEGLGLEYRRPPMILRADLEWSEVEVPPSRLQDLQITVSTKLSFGKPDPTLYIYNATGRVDIGGVAASIDDLKAHENERVRRWMSTIDDDLERLASNGYGLPPVFLVCPPLFTTGHIPDGNHRVLATTQTFRKEGAARHLAAYLAYIPKGLWLSWNLSTILMSYLRDPSVCVRLLRDRVTHARSIGDPLRPRF